MIKHVFLLICILCCFSCAQKPIVRFAELPERERIDVYIDEHLFTSFLYSDTLHKQVLYPIYTASGKSVTRGYPIDPQPGEQTDHPHQTGLWFNFGDVNGLDFWNNSYRVPEERTCYYGSILLNRITKMDAQSKTLAYESDWADCHKHTLLKEATSYTFDGKLGFRSIIRKTTLTATDTDIRFTENKEGLFALRVGADFEEVNSGVYQNKQGDSKGDVWGKRSPWVCLSSKKDNEEISIVIIDHPSNINYPGWWHARGYGLFAINNLGGSAFDEDAEKVVIDIRKGSSITFTYKILIKNGGFITENEINKEANF